MLSARSRSEPGSSSHRRRAPSAKVKLELFSCIEGYGDLTRSGCAARYVRARALRDKPAIDLPADMRHCRDCAVGSGHARGEKVPLLTTRSVVVQAPKESPRSDQCSSCNVTFVRHGWAQRYCKACRQLRELQRWGGSR